MTAQARSRGFMAATAGLAAAVIWWSAAPISAAGAGARIALIAAIVTAAGSLGQLAMATVATPADDYDSVLVRIVGWLVDFVKTVRWPELMTVSVLVLEALHRSRPWHTAILGAAVVCFLLALHMAESRADTRILRRQLPLLSAGLGLSALAVGAAALPSPPASGLSAIIRIVAATVGVIAAGLSVPVWLTRKRS